MSNLKQIIAGCVKGESYYQMELYRLYFNWLFTIVNNIVPQSDESEDIVHQAYIRLFGVIKKYKDKPESVKFALRRIAINLSIDFLRRRKINFVDESYANRVAADSEYDQESVDLENVAVREIKEAIDKLAEGSRIIFILRAIEEYEYSEIAEELSISQSAVRSQYTRAKQKIINIIKLKS